VIKSPVYRRGSVMSVAKIKSVTVPDFDEYIEEVRLPEHRTVEHSNMKAVYEKKSQAYIITKRFFDIILAGAALVALSPVFLITAIAIKLEDNGPVFFTQLRAGKELVPFKIYKFRSMYVDADARLQELMADNEQTGHAFKIKNDPRVTKVGKVIRRLSIDELPQLINIVKGDMSIVGPRPILLFQMEECDAYDRQRLIVQPGLTCYWQISGRANIKWDKWVELDLDYIDDMSLWTDIKMIIKTIPVIFVGDGAY
jgi:lipopolysaccharide/colanic/teichoic acid biosynthesis glycosyltransferase